VESFDMKADCMRVCFF